MTVIVASVAVSMWAWNSSPINLKDRIFPKHLTEVYTGSLYRSGQIDSRLLRTTLEDLQIDVIVDLTGDQQRPDQLFERELAEELGIEHRIFSLGGSGIGAIDQYVGAVEVIARAVDMKRPVLVHCRAGDRRTGGVVAAYQLLIRGEPVERAFAEVARYSRTPVSESRVWSFLQANLSRISEGLVARGLDLSARVTRDRWTELESGFGSTSSGAVDLVPLQSRPSDG